MDNETQYTSERLEWYILSRVSFEMWEIRPQLAVSGWDCIVLRIDRGSASLCSPHNKHKRVTKQRNKHRHIPVHS